MGRSHRQRMWAASPRCVRMRHTIARRAILCAIAFTWYGPARAPRVKGCVEGCQDEFAANVDQRQLGVRAFLCCSILAVSTHAPYEHGSYELVASRRTVWEPLLSQPQKMLSSRRC